MVLYAFPGFLSADSADQLDQARRWDLGDWHPPVMGAIWWFCECFIAGPLGMLLLQVTGFVIGTYFVLRTQLSRNAAAFTVLAIGWFPPNLAVMGVIWKDSQMAAFALLGIACLLTTSRRLKLAGLFCFLIASAMRHNAAALTLLPLVLLWSAPLVPGARGRSLLDFARGAGAWLGVTATAFLLSSALARNQEHPWVTSIALTDVVGTIALAPELTDDQLRELLQGATLEPTENIQAAMAASDFDRGWLYYIGAEPPLALPRTAAERDAVRRAWGRLVRSHPSAYLRHRWRMFKQVMRIGEEPAVPRLTMTFNYQAAPELAARLRHEATRSRVQQAWFRLVRRTPGVAFQPMVYMAIALLLLPMAYRHRIALAVLCSGIAYQLPLFFVAPSADYRYSHWLIVTTVISAVLVFENRRRGDSGDVRRTCDREVF
jgi:hypothetical protein